MAAADTEVLVHVRGRVRRALLVRETASRMLVRVAYVTKAPGHSEETWVHKAARAAVESRRVSKVGCVAPPLPDGQVSVEVEFLRKEKA